MIRWRGGAVARGGRAWLLAAAALATLTGCPRASQPVPSGPRRDPDAAVFQECDSVCVRPGDCMRAFNDDGVCPAGFVCVLRYSGCNSD